MKTYLGVRHLKTESNSNRQIFKAKTEPTEKEYPQFIYIIGPFKTLRGAEFMRDYGYNNPHCQHVNDAEKLAKLEAN